MKHRLALITALLLATFSQAGEKPFRPPAVPLVAHDPYFSVWSRADKLTDLATSHWSRRPQPLNSVVRIDGKPFRVLGVEPKEAPALEQSGVTVLPTRTICEFAGAGIKLTLTFTTPALPEDLSLLARPVTYLTWTVVATDGNEHAVEISFTVSGLLAVNDAKQEVVWGQENFPGLVTLRVGSKEQPVLQKAGDNLAIDWGYLYVAAPGATAKLSEHTVVFDSVKVGAAPVSRWLMLAYDEIWSIQYFGHDLRPYWRKDGWEPRELLETAAREYEPLGKRCAAFDEEVMSDMRALGGDPYANICALAYRQCWAGNGWAADENGAPMVFPKENTSNGDISTLDVIYPMAPQFLLFGPTLTKAILVPVMEYVRSPLLKGGHSAPHDLGAYPRANGNGGSMPVEETGNMLILLAALAKMEGNADFCAPYWPKITQWAEYLKAKGVDPDNQLSTDDFMGPAAHQVNLSAKSIVALGAYAQLCRLRGDSAVAKEYEELARESAAWWVKESDDGDHSRLGFDMPGTWSQKYNLVWDRLLGLDLFPSAVLRKEVDFYRNKKMNAFGVPLDSRKSLAKVDWTLWTATLTGDRADFDALVLPVYHQLITATGREPFNDVYETTNGATGWMISRPVIGGVFLKALDAPALWKKWAARDQTRTTAWAPFPAPPQVTKLWDATKPLDWQVTTQKPPADWAQPGFDDSAWPKGAAPFLYSVEKKPDPKKIGEVHRWLRREFDVPEAALKRVQVWMVGENEAEMYINGVLAVTCGRLRAWETVKLSPAGQAALEPGRNLVAIHMKQDPRSAEAGLVEVNMTGK